MMNIDETLRKIQDRRRYLKNELKLETYSGELLPPCHESAIKILRHRFHQELGINLPQDLESFFRKTKGIGHNGVCFWLDETDLRMREGDSTEEDRSWRIGIVERTLEFWEMMPHNRPLIQVGAHDSGWYVYDPRTQEYADMDTCGDILYRTRSFEELFEYAFKDRLG